MGKKNSDIVKNINKKIDDAITDKEIAGGLKSELKEIISALNTDDFQEQLEQIYTKLESLETKNASLKDSVYDFVSSSSKTIEALAKIDNTSDSSQITDVTDNLKNLETKLDKLIKNNSEETATSSDVFNDETQFKKLKTELTFFQNTLEEKINENHEDLRETVSTIVSGLKEQVSDIQELFEKNTEKYIVEILSDIKQLKADVSEVYDAVKSIDNQAIFETEKNVKQLLENEKNSAQNIQSEITEVKNLTAKEETLETKSKEAIDTFKNELSILRANIHTQIREVLSKILKQDEIKFLCEEAITGIKNNTGESVVIRKYLKDIKNEDERHYETINEIKNIISELSEYEMNESSDKIDIIYENMAILNGWADSSDKMMQNFDGLKDDFYKLEGVFDEFKEDFSLTADKIDIIYDNLSFINEWVKKLDEISENLENIKTGFDTETDLQIKINEITEQIALVKEWNKKADALALQVKALSVQISETESTVNSKNLADMKQLFVQMTEDMSNLSSRTNKMILESDKTHEKMQEHLQNLKDIMNTFDEKAQYFNLEDLKHKIDDIKEMSSKSTNLGEGLTESFLYLAEWIDSAGNAINEIKSELNVMKEQQNDNVDRTNLLSVQQREAFEKIQDFLSQKFGNSQTQFDENSILEIITHLRQLNEQNVSSMKQAVDTQNLKIDEIREQLIAQNNKFETINEQIFSQENIIEKLNNQISGITKANEANTLAYKQNLEKNDIALQQIATQQALNQQILQDIKENKTEKTENTNISNDFESNVSQNLLDIKQMLQQNQFTEENQDLIKEAPVQEDSLIFGSKNYNEEIKNLLDFVATQVVSISENNARTDAIEKKLDSLEGKITNLEQYMAKLIDYLEED